MPRFKCCHCDRSYIDVALELLIDCPYCGRPLRDDGLKEEED